MNPFARHTTPTPVRDRHQAIHSALADESKPMAVTSQPLFRVAHDIGTTSTCTTFTILDPGISDITYDVEYGPEGDDPNFSPAIFWYDPQGRLRWGHELLHEIQRDRIPASEVFRDVKLAAFRHPDTQSFRDDFDSHLLAAGKSEEDFWEAYLKGLMETTKSYALNQVVGLRRPNLDSMLTEVFVTVPETFHPAHNMPLAKAARNAGSPGRRSLVFQPLAIAVIADFGGGFACLTPIQVIESPDIRSDFAMRVIGGAMNFPCGSMMINKHFRSYLEKGRFPEIESMGGITEAAKWWGYSKEEFVAKVCEEFETSCKKYFPTKNKFSVTIRAGLGERPFNSKEDFFCLNIPPSEMRDFYQVVINKVVETLAEMMRSAREFGVPKVVYLAGGFSKNVYLRKAIEPTIQQYGCQVIQKGSKAPFANSRGALLRLANSSILGLKHQLNLAVYRDEEWDPKRHPDATIAAGDAITGKGTPTRRPTYDPRVVIPGRYDPQKKYCENRLNVVYEDEEEVESWSTEYPPLDGDYKVIRKLVCSEEKLENGSPCFVSGTSTLLPHLKGFGDIEHNLNDRQSRGWGIVTHPNGLRTYKLFVCVRTFVSDDRVCVGLKIVDIAGLSEREVNMRISREHDPTDGWTDVEKVELISASHNPIARVRKMI